MKENRFELVFLLCLLTAVGSQEGGRDATRIRTIVVDLGT